jgi:hypothetical protein
MPYVALIRKTPATTYVIVHAPDLEQNFETVLQLAIESVDWRALGPNMTARNGGGAKPPDERETCPSCWSEITPAGTCWCA